MPIRFLCRIEIHNWGPWGEKFKIPNSGYAFEYQQRVCTCCGYVQERRIVAG